MRKRIPKGAIRAYESGPWGPDVQNEYFDWMIHLVGGGGYSGGLSYRKLFRLLHEMEFIYILAMDRNRADDGIDLRYRFAYERGYSAREMEEAMGGAPCSLLEMMAALALRCEEDITDDPDSGNRTGQWFFEMIESLGLKEMDDRHFDRAAAEDILSRFMRREYLPDGRGGLFTISDPGRDMRDMEIWYQLMEYLNEKLYGRGNNA